MELFFEGANCGGRLRRLEAPLPRPLPTVMDASAPRVRDPFRPGRDKTPPRVIRLLVQCGQPSVTGAFVAGELKNGDMGRVSKNPQFSSGCLSGVGKISPRKVCALSDEYQDPSYTDLVRVAVISAKNHKRQRRKRQSVTAEREKSQTPKVLTAILTLPNRT